MNNRQGVISVRLAMSLDGYIADPDGGYDWIVPVPSPALDTAHQLPFDDFLEGVDIVVMGRHCYDEGQFRDYVGLGKRVIIATSNPPAAGDAPESVEFCDDVVRVVTAARDRGHHCFVFGGGVLVSSFLAAQAIDLLTVGVVPVLLGGGRPLFPGAHPAHRPPSHRLHGWRREGSTGVPAALTSAWAVGLHGLARRGQPAAARAMGAPTGRSGPGSSPIAERSAASRGSAR